MLKTQVLLLCGANNHDWARSAPFLRDWLESRGDFTVTLTQNPSDFLENAEIARFDLFFVDYNGPMWSEAARAHFSAAVRAGTGVVLLHAASNSFDGWADYEQMCGLIWRGKRGSSHGEFGPLQVQIADASHPATRDLECFATQDELYTGTIPVENADFTVLATAFSDPTRGGSGQNEPAIVAAHFGAGRVFHHLLGHLWKGDPDGDYRGASLVALENAGFQNSLLQGCRWAARREALSQNSRERASLAFTDLG